MDFIHPIIEAEIEIEHREMSRRNAVFETFFV